MRPIDADHYREEMYNSREFNYFTILDMQETLDVKPILHGKWIDNRCSNCNKESLLKRNYDMDGTSLEYELSNYCPYCGAEMLSEKENGNAKV